MSDPADRGLVSLDVREPIWERFFTVAPLVLVGTTEPEDGIDLAPKHMVSALSWENYVGFVCHPSHGTHANARRTGVFTMSYLRPEQVLSLSLAAAPRAEDESKPALAAIPTFPAQEVAGALVEGAYLHLECALDRIVEGLGGNSLIIGRIVAAHVHEKALREQDRDDAELLAEDPLLVYLQYGRMASVSHSDAFPFPAGFRR